MKALALGSVAALVGGSSDCDLAVELVILQDGSTSFLSLMDEMVTQASQFIAAIQEDYSDLRLGISTFVDKPSPFRGDGAGRGLDPEIEYDYCYKRMISLTKDLDKIQGGFSKLMKLNGVGGDYPENPYEGALYTALDSALLFSGNKQTARFVLIITDDLPHYEGDAQQGIDWWNHDSTNTDGPHFWDPTFIDSVQYYPQDSPAIYDPDANRAKYSRMLELHELGSRTSEQESEYQTLYKLLGPDFYEAAKPHPGTYKVVDECAVYEYPSLTTVSKALQDAGLTPIILMATPDWVGLESYNLCVSRGYDFDIDDPAAFVSECAVKIYEEDLAEMGLPYYAVDEFSKNGADLTASVKRILKALAESMNCDPPTPIPTPVPTQPPAHHDRMSGGKIAGIVVGATAGFGALLACCAFGAVKKFKKEPIHSMQDIDYECVAEPEIPNRDVTQVLQVDMFL